MASSSAASSSPSSSSMSSSFLRKQGLISRHESLSDDYTPTPEDISSKSAQWNLEFLEFTLCDHRYIITVHFCSLSLSRFFHFSTRLKSRLTCSHLVARMCVLHVCCFLLRSFEIIRPYDIIIITRGERMYFWWIRGTTRTNRLRFSHQHPYCSVLEALFHNIRKVDSTELGALLADASRKKLCEGFACKIGSALSLCFAYLF